MNVEMLSREFHELLADVRSAGSQFDGARMDGLLEAHLPRLVLNADQEVERVMSEAARATGIQRVVAALGTGMKDSNQEVRLTWEPIFRSPVRPWAWGIGLTGSAAILVLMAWLAGYLAPRPVPIAHPGPRVVTPETPPQTHPKPNRSPLAKNGPETRIRTTPLPGQRRSDDLIVQRTPPPAGTFGTVVGVPLVFAPGAAHGVVARPNTVLAYGSRIETGDYSRAQVRFVDGTTLNLDFNTVLVVPEPGSGRRPGAIENAMKARPALVLLEEGMVDASVVHRAELPNFRLKTPVATAEVLGTEFRLKLSKDNAKLFATLQVNRGRVLFFNDFGSQAAGDQMETSAGSETAPTEPKRIGTLRDVRFSRHGHAKILQTATLAEIEAWQLLVFPRGYVGLSGIPAPGGGIRVLMLDPASPARDAGLVMDDVVLSVNGESVHRQLDLERLARLSNANPIQLVVRRGSELRKIAVRSLPTPVWDRSLPRQREPNVEAACRMMIAGNWLQAERSLQSIVASKPSALAWASLGVLHEFRERFGSAIQCYKEAVALSPRALHFRRLLAVALTKIGNLDRAAEVHRASASMHPDSWLALNGLVDILDLANSPSEALTRLESWIARFPKHAAAWAAKADVLLALHRVDEAMKAAETAVHFDPNDAQALFSLAEVYHDLGRYREGVELLKKARGAGHLGVHHNLGVLYSDLGQFAEAEAAFRETLLLGEDRALVRDALAHVLKQLNRLPEAEVEFRRAIRLDPGFANARNGLGSTLYRTGRLAEAERELRTAIRLDPDFATAHFNLGLVLEVTNRQSEAESEYRIAIRISPDGTVFWSQLGILLSRKGRNDEAERMLKRALELDPGHSVSLKNLGALYLKLGRSSEAEAVLRKFMGSDPFDTQVLSLLGTMLYQRGQRVEALRLFRNAAEVDPESFYALSYIVWILVELEQDLDEALRLGLKCIKLAPTDSNAVANVGWVYFKLKDLANAETYLSKALVGTAWGKVNHEGQAGTWATLGLVYERSGQRSKAFEAFRQALSLDAKEPTATEGIKRIGGNIGNLAASLDPLSNPLCAICPPEFLPGPW